jgi:two-component system, OmpR family, sensor histidine kinase MtrB
VLERACAAVAGGFGFERVGIVRFLPETATLVPFAAHGLTQAELEALPPALPVASFPTFGRALAAGQAVFVEDPSEERAPDEIAERFGLGSFVIVPLVSDGRCLGFMTCDERAVRFTLDDAEVDLLTTFGTLIAAFLEKAIEHGELRRLNELKSQFAALASHELRTPVAAIYGAVMTLEARAGLLTGEQEAAIRRMLSQQTKRLYELVENLLDLSRLEADSIRIEPAELDVAERLRAIATAVLEPDAELTFDVPSGLRAVVDAPALERIVSNLVANAVRHGGPPYLLAATAEGGDLTVTVEDRGPGVPPEFAPSLFERFTRGATSASEGAGLGLSIAQSYARAHGGALTYEPLQPHGSRFRLVLPASATTRPASGQVVEPSL